MYKKRICCFRNRNSRILLLMGEIYCAWLCAKQLSVYLHRKLSGSYHGRIHQGFVRKLFEFWPKHLGESGQWSCIIICCKLRTMASGSESSRSNLGFQCIAMLLVFQSTGKTQMMRSCDVSKEEMVASEWFDDKSTVDEQRNNWLESRQSAASANHVD